MHEKKIVRSGWEGEKRDGRKREVKRDRKKIVKGKIN